MCQRAGLAVQALGAVPGDDLEALLAQGRKELKQQFRTPQRLDGMRGRGGNRRRFAAGQLDLDDPRAAGLHQVADFRMTCEEGLRVLFELAPVKVDNKEKLLRSGTSGPSRLSAKSAKVASPVS